MRQPLLCLAAFAAWAVVLVVGIAGARVFQVLAGRKRANEFPSGTPHGGDAYWRLNRAHMNTVENLPIFGALVVAGVLLRVEAPSFQVLPVVVICARVVQSLVHVSSGRSMAVNVRFTAFVTQLICFLGLLFLIVRTAL
jgi:uncharacterized MAPEG superfamily protein